MPFGLRSAPKIFSAVADALNWMLEQSGVRHSCHSLDDFIVLGPAGSFECHRVLDSLTSLCKRLGVPLAPHKLVNPTTCLIFLGIEVDSVASQLRLLADKLARVWQLISEWRGRKACRRNDLESLVGLLNHACKVVRSGRYFLRSSCIPESMPVMVPP